LNPPITAISQFLIYRRIQVRGAKKMNPVMGCCGCVGIMAASTVSSMLAQNSVHPYEALNQLRSLEACLPIGLTRTGMQIAQMSK
jgi:hypothetical protein